MSMQISREGLVNASLVVILLGVSAIHAAEFTKPADGMTVHLGVTPAAAVQGTHDPKMHGGTRSGKGSHHVMVALFDRASGQRINKAIVMAKVGEVGLAAVQKKMDPMEIDNTVTWGNHFQMTGPGQYQIAVKIRRPGATGDVNVIFDYTKPRR